MRLVRVIVGLVTAAIAGALAVVRVRRRCPRSTGSFTTRWFDPNRPASATRARPRSWPSTRPASPGAASGPGRRDLVAENLVERLHGFGATAVAFDVLFAEANRQEPAADGRFALSLARVPSVLGHGLLFDSIAAPPGCHLRPVELVERQRSKHPPHAGFFEVRGAICPLPVLAKAAGATGFINASPILTGGCGACHCWFGWVTGSIRGWPSRRSGACLAADRSCSTREATARWR